MIYHVLKDGSRVESIRDIVIGSNQFPQVYKVIEQIEKRGNAVVNNTSWKGAV